METTIRQIDLSVLKVGTLQEDPLEETRFWLTKTPQERLAAVELLRMRLADYDNTTSRLQRFFTVTVRPWGCLFVSWKIWRKIKLRVVDLKTLTIWSIWWMNEDFLAELCGLCFEKVRRSTNYYWRITYWWKFIWDLWIMLKPLISIFSIWLVYMLYVILTLPFLVRFGGERTIPEKITILLINTPLETSDSKWFFPILTINGLFWALISWTCFKLIKWIIGYKKMTWIST